MKRYMVMLAGVGEGCDYSPLGCNSTHHIVEASNEEELKEKVFREHTLDEIESFSYALLDNVTIVDLRETKKEFEEYKRLHNKYGWRQYG